MAYVMVKSLEWAQGRITPSVYRVFVEKWCPKADLVVYVTDEKKYADCCEEYWKFTTLYSQARAWVAFVKERSQSNLVICYTEGRNQAGWRDKKHRLKGQFT